VEEGVSKGGWQGKAAWGAVLQGIQASAVQAGVPSRLHCRWVGSCLSYEIQWAGGGGGDRGGEGGSKGVGGVR